MKILTAFALLMIFAGIISGVLHFFDYNLKILFWINELPQNQQWLIRTGLVLLGVAILVIFRKKINAIKK